MGFKDFFSNAFDSVADTARNTKDAIKYKTLLLNMLCKSQKKRHLTQK